MADYDAFDLGAVTLQRGLTLPKAHLAYKTYGKLAADKLNVIVYPTASYGAQHSDIDWLIGPGRVLDPDRNGSSSSRTSSATAFRRRRAICPSPTVSDAIPSSPTGTMCTPRSAFFAKFSA